MACAQGKTTKTLACRRLYPNDGRIVAEIERLVRAGKVQRVKSSVGLGHGGDASARKRGAALSVNVGARACRKVPCPPPC
jgi:hypothetical protein